VFSVHGTSSGRVPAALAAEMDRNTGQELQAAHAQGLHGVPHHWRNMPLVLSGKSSISFPSVFPSLSHAHCRGARQAPRVRAFSA